MELNYKMLHLLKELYSVDQGTLEKVLAIKEIQDFIGINTFEDLEKNLQTDIGDKMVLSAEKTLEELERNSLGLISGEVVQHWVDKKYTEAFGGINE